MIYRKLKKLNGVNNFKIYGQLPMITVHRLFSASLLNYPEGLIVLWEKEISWELYWPLIIVYLQKELILKTEYFLSPVMARLSQISLIPIVNMQMKCYWVAWLILHCS